MDDFSIYISNNRFALKKSRTKKVVTHSRFSKKFVYLHLLTTFKRKKYDIQKINT